MYVKQNSQKNHITYSLLAYNCTATVQHNNMNLNMNVNLELRQPHAQLHMHHRLTRYIIIATIHDPSHRVKKWMEHGSTPSVDPWPSYDPFPALLWVLSSVPPSPPRTEKLRFSTSDGRHDARIAYTSVYT